MTRFAGDRLTGAKSNPYARGSVRKRDQGHTLGTGASMPPGPTEKGRVWFGISQDGRPFTWRQRDTCLVTTCLLGHLERDVVIEGPPW